MHVQVHLTDWWEGSAFGMLRCTTLEKEGPGRHTFDGLTLLLLMYWVAPFQGEHSRCDAFIRYYAPRSAPDRITVWIPYELR